jgi:hypothetical protein
MLQCRWEDLVATAPRRKGRAGSGSRQDDQVHERVGRAVERFLEARRRGKELTVEECLSGCSEEEQDLVRQCLRVADLLLELP